MSQTRRSRGEGSLFRRGQIWWMAYYNGGKQIQESTRTTSEREAVKRLRQRLGELGTGTFVGPDADRVTFDDLCALVRTSYRTEGRRSIRRMEQALTRLRESFAGRRALQITLPYLTAYVTHRQEEGAARATIAYELAILRRAFTVAVRGNLLPRRPSFPTLALDNARKGFFEIDELQRLLPHIAHELRGVLQFAYLTGWRVPSEVLPLRWEQVDLQAGVVRLEIGTTKNREGRTFPLDALPDLHKVLRDQRAYTDLVESAQGKSIPWVFHRFGKPIKEFRSAWKNALAEAGLPVGRLCHDFRRSAVRNLERAGVSRSVAMKLTGHKTEAVYRRYAIVSEVDLREGVAKLARLTTVQQQSST